MCVVLMFNSFMCYLLVLRYGILEFNVPLDTV